MIDRLRDEPVLVTTLVAAVIALLVAFNVPVSDEQSAAIIGVIIAVSALVARSKVVPSRRL